MKCRNSTKVSRKALSTTSSEGKIKERPPSGLKKLLMFRRAAKRTKCMVCLPVEKTGNSLTPSIQEESFQAVPTVKTPNFDWVRRGTTHMSIDQCEIPASDVPGKSLSSLEARILPKSALKRRLTESDSSDS